MSICQFDGTETENEVCPTCKDYKGLNLTPLTVALDDVFELMDEARQYHLETHTNDCDCREGEE